jgi:hypothetical protein
MNIHVLVHSPVRQVFTLLVLLLLLLLVLGVTWLSGRS